jgi:anti-repressor protein
VDVQPFDFDGMQVRVVMQDGDPWWVAADVACALGFRDAANGVRAARLRDRQQGYAPVSTPGGTQRVLVVSESGVYRMVMASRHEQAERFQDWVTDVVLPAIRKTGSYSVAKAEPEVALDLRNPLHQAKALAQTLEIIGELQAANAQARETIAVLEPKAAQADQHREADGLRAIDDFANELKDWAKREHGVRVKNVEVWDFLGELGILIRGETIRRNQPTAFARERGFIKVKVGERPSKSCGTKATTTSRLTPAGEGWVWDRAVKRIAEHRSLRKPESTAIASVAP